MAFIHGNHRVPNCCCPSSVIQSLGIYRVHRLLRRSRFPIGVVIHVLSWPPRFLCQWAGGSGLMTPSTIFGEWSYYIQNSSKYSSIYKFEIEIQSNSTLCQAYNSFVIKFVRLSFYKACISVEISTCRSFSTIQLSHDPRDPEKNTCGIRLLQPSSLKATLYLLLPLVGHNFSSTSLVNLEY